MPQVSGVYDASMTGANHPRTMVKSVTNKTVPAMFQGVSQDDRERNTTTIKKTKSNKQSKGSDPIAADRDGWLPIKPRGCKPQEKRHVEALPDVIELSDSDEDVPHVDEVSQEIRVPINSKKRKRKGNKIDSESEVETQGPSSPLLLRHSASQEEAPEGVDDIVTIPGPGAKHSQLSDDEQAEPPSSKTTLSHIKWVRKMEMQGFRLLEDDSTADSQEDEDLPHRCQILMNGQRFMGRWSVADASLQSKSQKGPGDIWMTLKLHLQKFRPIPPRATGADLTMRVFTVNACDLFLEDCTGRAPHTLEGNYDGHLISMRDVTKETWDFLKKASRSQLELAIERTAEAAVRDKRDPSYYRQSKAEILHFTRGWDRLGTAEMSEVEQMRMRSMPEWHWLPLQRSSADGGAHCDHHKTLIRTPKGSPGGDPGGDMRNVALGADDSCEGEVEAVPKIVEMEEVSDSDNEAVDNDNDEESVETAGGHGQGDESDGQLSEEF